MHPKRSCPRLMEFGVMYNVHYVSELLRNLGFSHQKARFVSDHLNDEKREEWLNDTWPTLVELARRTGALLLFGDEASFAKWVNWLLSLSAVEIERIALTLTCIIYVR